MKVMLGDQLEEYLHEHHYNTITLELSRENEKHVNEFIISKPRAEEPRIIFSKPINVSSFNKYLVDDITVYVAKDIKAENDVLEIVDQRVGAMDTCHVNGWIGYRN